jgi:hypothetical protein
MILVGGFGWVGSAVGIARKTNVLPNDDGSLNQGVAGVVVEGAAGNIFELFVADRLGFLDFFVHGSGFLFGWFALVLVLLVSDRNLRTLDPEQRAYCCLC